MTPFGAGFFALLGLVLEVLVLLAPPSRYGSSSDQMWIILLVTVTALALWGVAIRGVVKARERPLWT